MEKSLKNYVLVIIPVKLKVHISEKSCFRLSKRAGETMNFFTENDTAVYFTQILTLQCRFLCNSECNSMLFFFNTITVMYMSSSITGMLYIEKLFF